MSRVYFHSPEGDAEVRGSERAYFSCLIADLFFSILDVPVHGGKEDPFFTLIPPESYIHDELRRSGNRQWSYFIESLRCWMAVPSDSIHGYLMVEGQRVDIFGAQLDTAITIGSQGKRISNPIDTSASGFSKNIK